MISHSDTNESASFVFCLDDLEREKERILRFEEELVHNSKDAKGWWVGMQEKTDWNSKR